MPSFLSARQDLKAAMLVTATTLSTCKEWFRRIEWALVSDERYGNVKGMAGRRWIACHGSKIEKLDTENLDRVVNSRSEIRAAVCKQSIWLRNKWHSLPLVVMSSDAGLQRSRLGMLSGEEILYP